MQNSKLFKTFFLPLVIISLFFAFTYVKAQTKSASLFLLPSSGSYKVGSNFSITLAVNSPTESINAAEALLKFDPSIIQVRNISNAGSIFKYWPEEPTFSNSAGTIKFVGGSPKDYYYYFCCY